MDELPDIPNNSAYDHELDKSDNMEFILTNARSLQPKLVSLVDYFDELRITFALITETWLKKDTLVEVENILHHERSQRKMGKS